MAKNLSDFFITNGITIVGLIYLGLVLFMFLFKGNTKRLVSKFYFGLSVLAIISMIVLMVAGACAVHGKINLATVLARIQIFLTLEWISFLVFYFSLAFKKDDGVEFTIKKYNKLMHVFGIVSLILNIVCCIFLPFNYSQSASRHAFVMGGLLDTYYKICGVFILITAIFFLVKDRKTTTTHAKTIIWLFFVIYAIAYLIVYLFKIEISNIPFLMAAIQVVLYLSVESQDKALLDEFNTSVVKADESNKLRSEFIMNMSHQLRTPMNTILGFSETIISSDERNENNVKDDAKNIMLAATNLNNLINSIIDISVLESNKESVKMDNYNLDTVIYDVSSHVNAKILKDNLVFTINVDENCSNDLVGDGQKICKILNIIILNAVNHTNYGEVSLNVSSVQIDSANHEFTFLIKNSGHAMDVKNFDLDFDDLIKVSNENNYNIDADTLNFIIAKKLIDMIGGSIEFINEPGKGTQYIIKLKQKLFGNGLVGNIREKIQTKHAITHNVLNLLDKKILIIDEQKVNITILQRMLSKYNVTIDTSLNSREGVDIATNNNYDMIIVNHNMKEMSGVDVINRLTSTGNRVPPVIGIVTKNDDSSVYSNYYDVIVAPVEFRMLNRVVNKVFSYLNGGNSNGL